MSTGSCKSLGVLDTELAGKPFEFATPLLMVRLMVERPGGQLLSSAQRSCETHGVVVETSSAGGRQERS